MKATRKPLSRERVLATAVALVDSEGIQALTMRRLAAVLGVEAMSLYYHLPAKEALLDGVVETVLNEIGAAVAEVGDTPAGDWRAVPTRRGSSAPPGWSVPRPSSVLGPGRPAPPAAVPPGTSRRS